MCSMKAAYTGATCNCVLGPSGVLRYLHKEGMIGNNTSNADLDDQGMWKGSGVCTKVGCA